MPPPNFVSWTRTSTGSRYPNGNVYLINPQFNAVPRTTSWFNAPPCTTVLKLFVKIYSKPQSGGIIEKWGNSPKPSPNNTRIFDRPTKNSNLSPVRYRIANCMCATTSKYKSAECSRRFYAFGNTTGQFPCKFRSLVKWGTGSRSGTNKVEATLITIVSYYTVLRVRSRIVVQQSGGVSCPAVSD